MALAFSMYIFFRKNVYALFRLLYNFKTPYLSSQKITLGLKKKKHDSMVSISELIPSNHVSYKQAGKIYVFSS